MGQVSQAGVNLAWDIHDEMKKAVDAHPTRCCVKEWSFVGAMMSGSVGGDGTFLDDPQFDTLLSAFDELDAPLFLHLGILPCPQSTCWFPADTPPLSAELCGGLLLSTEYGGKVHFFRRRLFGGGWVPPVDHTVHMGQH